MNIRCIGHSGLQTLARLVAMVLVCLLTTRVDADVLIVLSTNSEQYQLCADKAKADLVQAGERVIEIKELKQIKQSDLDELGSDDVCLVIGAKAAVGMSRVLEAQVPMVYAMVSNPGDLGLTTRANTVGISADVSAIDQFKIMELISGKTMRVGMLYRSSSKRSTNILKQAQALLPTGWKLEAVDMDQFSTDSSAVETLTSSGVDFAWMISDPKVYSAATVKALLIASIQNKVMVFAFSPQVVKAGALVGFGIDPVHQGKVAGELAIKVLNGTSADVLIDIPWAQPQIAVNTVVASRLGISIPQVVLQRSENVYE